MSSAKTLNLLATAHTYKAQGKKVVVLKPALDTRFGKSQVVTSNFLHFFKLKNHVQVASRAGLDREADFLLENDTVLPASLFDEVLGNCCTLIASLTMLLSPGALCIS